MTDSGQSITQRWIPNSGQIKADYLILTGTGEGKVWGTLVYKDGKQRRTKMRIDVLHREYRLARS